MPLEIFRSARGVQDAVSGGSHACVVSYEKSIPNVVSYEKSIPKKITAIRIAATATGAT